MEKSEFRVLIEHCFLQGKSIKETEEKLAKYYKESAPSQAWFISGSLNFVAAIILAQVMMNGECEGPLNRGIAPNAHAAVTLNFPRAISRSHHNHMHDTDTQTYQNECTAE